MSDEKTALLTLEQIAAWELPAQLAGKEHKTIKATLPSLQRGFVWEAHQTELLWDSIVQGFPIGSLLLSERPKDDKTSRTIEGGEKKEKAENSSTHFLLDGQQRTTDIVLGFRNIWGKEIGDAPKRALWVDLAPGDLKDDERQFLFRVVTQAHPWGYRKTFYRDKIKVLSASDARDAFELFKKANETNKVKNPHDLKIKDVMPWDANAPVPLPLLIEAIRYEGDNIDKVAKNLKESLEKNVLLWKFWPEEKVEPILDDKGKREHFEKLVKGLSNALNNLKIPAPILTINKKDESEDKNQPIFNLFKRINTGGTTLSIEDINYSMLKSIWPEARKVIEEKLLYENKIAEPARMVSLMMRLFLMTEKEKEKEKKGLQAELTIAQFRNTINDKKFEKSFKEYCQGNGRKTLDCTWDLLISDDYGLPIVLASQISHQADDLFLLIMYWVHLLGYDFKNIDRKRTLGFITAITWFSDDKKRCARRLGNRLLEKEYTSKIPDFFNHEQFSYIVKHENEKRKHTLMPPLPTPFAFKTALDENKNKNKENGKKDYLYDFYGGDNTPKEMKDFFENHMHDYYKGKAKDVWWSFLHRVCLRQDHHFLLYAQRQYMDKRFGWFDPTRPEQIQGHNRPWDYDHILPYSWTNYDSKIKSGIPHWVKIWVNSNGNFRAWPLELNRAKGNSEIIEKKVEGSDDVCKDSFINNKEQWGDILENFKKDKEGKIKNDAFIKEGPHQEAFVDAVIQRNVDIYREWYDELYIASLMENSSAIL